MQCLSPPSWLRQPRRLAWLALALGPAVAPMAPAAAPAADPPAENALIALWREEAEALEHGDGVPRDGARAAELYCKAARLGDPQSQFNLGWMYANGRGVERSDVTAAFFFNAAAEQGYEQARRMLSAVGGPTSDVPPCMRAPTPPSPVLATAPAAPRPLPVPAAAPSSVVRLVTQMAPEYKVQPQLVLAIIEAESNFNLAALSPRNAKGLMQLIPATAERFNVRNPYDPGQNIRGGMAYLRWLLAYFEGDVALVAAAYNAGEGTVERYRGVPPYLETRAYVRRILALAGISSHPYDASVTAPSPRLRQIRDPSRL